MNQTDKRLNGSGLALGMFAILLGLGGKVFAGQLTVDDYKLTDRIYDGIDFNCTCGGVGTFSEWATKASSQNPLLYSHIKTEKVATIEVKVPNFDDLGSIDPFTLAGRKRAAKLGANLISYENGVKNKATQRIARVTYTAYRVEYGKFLVPGNLLSVLSKTISDNSEFETSVEKSGADCIRKKTEPSDSNEKTNGQFPDQPANLENSFLKNSE